MSFKSFYHTYKSPMGDLILRGNGKALTGLWIRGQSHTPVVDPSWIEDVSPFHDVIQQLDEYFAGSRKSFTVPMEWCEGTPFQQAIWTKITEIPFGQTITYGELARRAKQPTAFRAAGAATGRNPISIINPCHRVVGTSGSLTGYSGGLEHKVWLLRHEGFALTPPPAVAAKPLASKGKGKGKADKDKSIARMRLTRAAASP